MYRFNENEVRKFSRVYFPHALPPLRFYRSLRVNYGRFRLHKDPLLRISFAIVHPVIRTLARIVRSLNNNLCFVIQRPDSVHYHEWIRDEDGSPRVKREYLQAKYGDFPD